MIRAPVSRCASSIEFLASPGQHRLQLSRKSRGCEEGVRRMKRMVSGTGTGAITPYPILRIGSFQIHPVSLSIHLPVFLFNCSGNHIGKHRFFCAVFLDCGHAPYHRSISLSQASSLLRGSSQWSDKIRCSMTLRPVQGAHPAHKARSMVFC